MSARADGAAPARAMARSGGAAAAPGSSAAAAPAAGGAADGLFRHYLSCDVATGVSVQARRGGSALRAARLAA
jgi:hypothetical protein